MLASELNDKQEYFHQKKSTNIKLELFFCFVAYMQERGQRKYMGRINKKRLLINEQPFKKVLKYLRFTSSKQKLSIHTCDVCDRNSFGTFYFAGTCVSAVSES